MNETAKEIYKQWITDIRNNSKTDEKEALKWIGDLIKPLKDGNYSVEDIIDMSNIIKNSALMDIFHSFSIVDQKNLIRLIQFNLKILFSINSELVIAEWFEFMFENTLNKKSYSSNFLERNYDRVIKFREPYIKLMDYFINQGELDKFCIISGSIERQLLVLWFEINSDKVYELIEKNKDNPDILKLFQRLNDKFDIFFKSEYLYLIEIASFSAIHGILKHGKIPNKFIENDFFISAFKRYSLSNQISIIELLEKYEYDQSFIDELHRLLNKTMEIDQGNYTENVFEMSSDKFKRIKKEIESSSFFAKSNVKDSDLWKIIDSEYNANNNYLANNYYLRMMGLYHVCRTYATKSIVDGLYPLNKLDHKQRVIYLKGTYNILIRVVNGDNIISSDQTSKDFWDFTLLNEKNWSHYKNGIMYAYYNGITPDMIAHIYPIDSLSRPAKYESFQTDRINLLLDSEDLNMRSLEEKTYSNLCIRIKNQGQVLKPACIICTEKLDPISEQRADEEGLQIIVLERTRDDIVENNEDIYWYLK